MEYRITINKDKNIALINKRITNNSKGLLTKEMLLNCIIYNLQESNIQVNLFNTKIHKIYFTDTLQQSQGIFQIVEL